MSTPRTKTLTLATDQWDQIWDAALAYQDEGPTMIGEGWKSEKYNAAWQAFDKALATQSTAFDATVALVAAEFARATSKFPSWPTDPNHALGVLQEEVGELAKEVLQLCYEPHKSSSDKVRAEAIQTAAMAIRFIMSLGKYDYRPGVQHSQGEVEYRPLEPGETIIEGDEFVWPDGHWDKVEYTLGSTYNPGERSSDDEVCHVPHRRPLTQSKP